MTTRSALTGKTINRFCKQQAKYIISKLSNLIKEQEEFISSNQNKYNALFEINKDKLNSSIIDSLLKTVSTDCKITYNTRSSLFKEYLNIPSSIFFRFKRLKNTRAPDTISEYRDYLIESEYLTRGNINNLRGFLK